jgi:hypothetical protein
MVYMIFFLVSTTRTFASENNQYHVCATFHGGVVFEAEEFSLRDGEQVLYQVDDPGIHTFFVSNHGTVFALSECHAVFYNQGGECDTLTTISFLNNSGFSEHRDLFYLSLLEGMYVYSLDGDLLYTLMPGRLFASTQHGENIAVAAADTLMLYTEGVLVHTKILETAYVQRLSFTETGAVRVEEHDGIEMFDMATGERIEQ